MSENHLPTLKGFELRDRIGDEGGFGIVYRAYQTTLKREVAIKVILPEHANKPDFIRRFEREAELVARLEHPHIVPLYDYWREPDGAYLVMRFLRGGSLRGKLRSGPLKLSDTLRILDQIASALTIAHRAGVIHRDIKPENILLDEDGNAYLADFGIAKDLNTPTDPKSQGGATFLYAAPEQLVEETISPQTDLYTFGLLVFEMLTGQLPYEGKTPFAMKQFQFPDESFNAIREADLAESVKVTLEKAMAQMAAERYTDARNFAHAMRSALTQTTSDSVVDAMDTAYTDDLGEIINPYKGLRAFQEVDSDDFFGRNALIEQLVQQLNSTHFLAIAGPSGSGKSSVVRAGLIPALRRGDIQNSENWFFTEMVPGEHPVQNLADALLRVAVNPPPKLMEQLLADTRALDWAVGSLLAGISGELFLLIDQLEELFTLATDEKERVHFMRLLQQAVTAPDTRIRVVVTLRADFMDRPLQYPEFGELLKQNIEFILPLNAAEIEQSVTGPATRVGMGVDSNLIAAVVADVREEPGALPLLQYALTEAFERREGRFLTLAGYRESGGVTGALAKRAEEVYNSLPENQQAHARQLFLRLITLGEGTEDTRRRARQSELFALSEETVSIQAILDAFGQYRLLTFDVESRERESTVEVAHEALLREWGRLRDWLAESRDDVRLERALANAENEWEKSGRDPSYLLTGTKLAQYEDWASATTLALTPAEHEFIYASVSERENRRAQDEARKAHEAELEKRALNNLRALVAILVITAVGAVGLSLFAVDREGQARDNAATATVALGVADANLRAAWDTQALFLADLSRQELERGAPQNAVNLAMLSLEHYPDGIFHPESHQALLNAVAYPVQEIAYLQHEGSVIGAVWNGDETRILSWSEDGTARVWDSTTDEQLLTFQHVNTVIGAVWNGDETRILSWSENNMARVWDATTGDSLLTLQHEDWVSGAAWNRDATRILSWSQDGTVRIWDATTGDPLLTLQHERYVSGAIWNRDATRILSWSDDRTARVWDATTGDPLLTLQHEDTVYGAMWNGDETRILSWSLDGTVQVWDATTGDPLLTLQHEGYVGGAMWNGDETRILSWSDDRTARVWDAESGEGLLTLRHEDKVIGAMWNRDATRILSWSLGGTLRVWDAESGTLVFTLQLEDGVSGAVWNGDETRILSWSSDGTVQVWDAKIRDSFLNLQHEDWVSSAMWNADETRILSWSRYGTAGVWDATTGDLRFTFQHEDAVFGVVWNRDETRILSWSSDGTARVWDATTGEQLLTLHHEAGVYNPTWNRDETRILSLEDGTARVWDAETAEELLRFPVGFFVYDLVWNADETRILSWSRYGMARVWDAKTGNSFLNLQHEDEVFGAVWNGNETRILSWSGDGTARVWDATTGEQLLTLQHENLVIGAVWNGDETRILSWSGDGTAQVWDATTGEQLLTLQHEHWVIGAVWNGDETRILSWSRDGTARVWDATTGEQHLTLQHEDEVFSAVWNGDETLILSWSGDGTARVWDTTTGDQRLTLQHEDTVIGAMWNGDETRILSWSGDGTARTWLVDLDQLLELGKIQSARRPLSNEEREQFFLPTLVPKTTPLPTLTPSVTPTPAN